MQNQDDSLDAKIKLKLYKTLGIAIAYNLILSAATCEMDRTTKAALCFLANTALFYSMHQSGKARRPGSNLINGIYSFFASQSGEPTYDINNAIRNIINGGAYYLDEIANFFKSDTNDHSAPQRRMR